MNRNEGTNKSFSIQLVTRFFERNFVSCPARLFVKEKKGKKSRNYAKG